MRKYGLYLDMVLERHMGGKVTHDKLRPKMHCTF